MTWGSGQLLPDDLKDIQRFVDVAVMYLQKLRQKVAFIGESHG